MYQAQFFNLLYIFQFIALISPSTTVYFLLTIFQDFCILNLYLQLNQISYYRGKIKMRFVMIHQHFNISTN